MVSLYTIGRKTNAIYQYDNKSSVRTKPVFKCCNIRLESGHYFGFFFKRNFIIRIEDIGCALNDFEKKK